MSASSQQKNTSMAEWAITDPGDGAAIPNDASGICSITTGSTGETNTLAVPVREGLQLTLNLAVDGGGDRVVTVATAHDEIGNTIITLANAGCFVTLLSVKTAASTYAWRVLGYDNVTGITLTSGGVYAAGNSTFGGNISVSGNIDINDGGIVTQATNKTTGVSLSTHAGKITMNSAALAAGAEVVFTVTNTNVGAMDIIVVNHASAGTAGAYLVGIAAVGSGSFDVVVSNISAGSLSEAIVINFVVFGGSYT